MFSQIAAISPADICYEETLSTLRYAERYIYEYFFTMVVLYWATFSRVLLLDRLACGLRIQEEKTKVRCNREANGKKTNEKKSDSVPQVLNKRGVVGSDVRDTGAKPLVICFMSPCSLLPNT